MAQPDGVADLRAHISGHLEGFKDELAELISYRTISAEGKALDEATDFITGKLRSMGFTTRKLTVPDSPPLVVAEMKGDTSRSVLFYNHYDVMPVEPLEEWATDPFVLQEKDGRMFARGIADDKGDLMARIQAVESLIDMYGRLPMSVRFVVEGEEELGSQHLQQLLLKGRGAITGDVCLWEGSDLSASGRPQLYLGMKGLLYVRMAAATASIDLHSQYAAVVANPAWKLTWILGRFKDRQGKVLIPGFYDDVVPPTSEELQRVTQNHFDAREFGEALGANEMLDPAPGSTTSCDLVFSPTCNIDGFVSGYGGTSSKTVLPAHAVANVDFRLVPNQNPDKIFLSIRKYVDDMGLRDVQLECHTSTLPGKTPIDTPSLRPLVDVAEEVYGMGANVWPSKAATGPISLFLHDLSIPTVVPPSVTHVGSACHAPNENILAANYPRAIEYFAKCILRLSATVA